MSHFALICQQRNAELPVSLMPPEILCGIFHILRDAETISYSDPSNYPAIIAGHLRAQLGWMKVLHVMHAWRNTALGDPTLWTSITASLGRTAFEETMRRRRDSQIPVHIDISSSYRGLRWANAFAANYIIHRTGLQSIASLQVVGPSLPLLQSQIQMPQLRSLRVHLSRDGPSTLPRELPLIDAPALQELYIHNVVPCEHSGTPTRPLDIAPLCNITYLNLSFASDRLDWQPMHVIWILSQTSGLEYFRLSGYSLVVPDQDTRADDSAYQLLHLDKLTHLELDTSFIGAAYLLWRIRVNRETRIVLVVDVQRRSETVQLVQAYRLMRECHLHSNSSSLSGFRTLRLHGSKHESDYTATLSAWREDAPQLLLDDFNLGDVEHSPPEVTLTFMCGPAPAPILPFEDVLRIISLDTVHNLSLYSLSSCGFHISTWLEVFPSLSRSPLRWLRLNGYLALTFIRNDEILRDKSVLPHLETVALFGIPWTPQFGFPDPRQFLTRLLEARAALGTPIPTVLVEESQHHTEALFGIVDRDVVHALEPSDEESAQALDVWEI
ncbi:hypothetical protein PENSPDRAFT_734814 [Peniophora sp. CONT]|nr:hypothetical protein PENSPDRAFT_734814 [Peniophora sp. CONT]